MKNNKKILGFLALAAIIAFLMLACSDDSNEPKGTYSLGTTMTFRDYQVWERNYSTTKLSNAHYEFKGNRNIVMGSIAFPVQAPPDPPTSYTYEFPIGSGEIKDGYLNLNIPALGNAQLLDSVDLLRTFFTGWYWDVPSNSPTGKISISPSETNGHMVAIITDSENIIRESLSGTKTSLSGEFINYIYVDRACTISADEVVQYTYTFNSFNLSLNAGWNAICDKQTYTSSGQSSRSWELKHPDHKWTIVAAGKTLADFNDIDP